MRILKAFGAKSLAVALALSMAPVAVPAGTPLLGASEAKAQDFFVGGPRHWRGDRGHWRGDRGRWRDWDRPRYRHRDRGDAAAAAIVGGIVGLGIGAALASPRYYEPAPRYYEPAPRYYERRVYRPKPVYRAAPRYYSSNVLRPWSREWYDYCSARYRSFDPRSGTFQPYHGPRQFCR